MSGSKPPRTEAQDRAERLAAALRANLHRRKDQKRARKTPADPAPENAPDRDGGTAPPE